MTHRERALALARGGQAALEANRGRINDLNVYPVPDGDTGSNLADTATRLAEGLTAVPDDEQPAAIARAASRAALMGARGNSGVILSQMIRGFAESLAGEAGAITPAGIARAFRGASDAAYGAVRQPVEGTMLTAIRAMADRAEQAAGMTIEQQLAAVLDAGDETVLATREMLPVLRDAGVVDAGAAGLVELVRGAVAGLDGRQPVASLRLAEAATPAAASLHVEDSPFRYCTTFLVEGEGIDAAALEREMEPLGDSLLVVGEPPTYKVHVHTDDPGAALSRAVRMGAIDGVDINDMHEGIREHSMRLLDPVDDAPARRADLVLTADTTAIVLDSTVDISDPAARHANWSMVPLTVSFGEQAYRDYLDITPEQFYERLRAASELPRTAAPAPGAWQLAFERLERYQRVLVLPVSSRLSATSQSAEIAARVVDPEGRRIRVLETLSVSLGTLLLAEGLQRRLVRGVSENELMAWYDDARAHLNVVISVETLAYLQRGGRIGRAQAMVGGMLRMRPILTLTDGEVAPLRRVRGRERAMAEFERFLEEHASGPDVHVAVVHAAAPEAADELVAMVRRVMPDAAIDHVGQLGAVVGTHGGPGTLGMAVLAQP